MYIQFTRNRFYVVQHVCIIKYYILMYHVLSTLTIYVILVAVGPYFCAFEVREQDVVAAWLAGGEAGYC